MLEMTKPADLGVYHDQPGMAAESRNGSQASCRPSRLRAAASSPGAPGRNSARSSGRQGQPLSLRSGAHSASTRARRSDIRRSYKRSSAARPLARPRAKSGIGCSAQIASRSLGSSGRWASPPNSGTTTQWIRGGAGPSSEAVVCEAPPMLWQSSSTNTSARARRATSA
jgi:hypothetical protein